MIAEHHLRRRGAAMLFRRAVPQNLQSRFEKKEIVKGLGAKTARTAQYLAHAMWSVCEEVFNAVRQDPTLTPTAINAMVAIYLADCRKAIEADSAMLALAAGNAQAQRRADVRDFAGLGGAIRRQAADNDLDIETETIADLANRVGVTIAPDTIDEQLAKQALGLALGEEYIRIAHRRANEPTGPVGVLMRSKLRLFNPLTGIQPPEMAYRNEASAPATLLAPAAPLPPPAQAALALTLQGPSRPATALNVQPPAAIVAPTVTAAPLPESQPAAMLLLSVAPSAAMAPASTPIFSGAWDDYLYRKIDSRKEINAKRRAELKSSGSTLAWIMGDKPVDSFTDADMKRFEKIFLKLPQDYKNFRTAGASPEDVIAAAAKLAETLVNLKDEKARLILQDRLKLTSPKTFNKHLSNFKGFLTEHKLPDITIGYHIWIDKSKRARRAERKPPIVENVEKLFQTPYWTGRRSAYHVTFPGDIIIRDGFYWAPLLCAHHGLRIEEAAQLRRRHFVWIEGIFCIDLENDPTLALKNDNALRCVPIHKGMFALGFDAYLSKIAPDDLIFGELSNDNAHGTYSESLIKRYGRYLRELFDRPTAKSLTNQGFRHLVAHLLKNTKMKRDWINELIGHEGERISEADRYDKGLYTRNLKEVVDLIELPIDYLHLRKLAEASERRQTAAARKKT